MSDTDLMYHKPSLWCNWRNFVYYNTISQLPYNFECSVLQQRLPGDRRPQNNAKRTYVPASFSIVISWHAFSKVELINFGNIQKLRNYIAIIFEWINFYQNKAYLCELRQFLACDVVSEADNERTNPLRMPWCHTQGGDW